MKINAKISILFSREGLRIEVYDEKARIQFLEVSLNEQQTCEALSRLANTECTAEVYDLDKVGKIRESLPFEFEMPEGVLHQQKKDIACAVADRLCPEDWTPSNYYGSQNSFFKRDGKEYARTTIYRWVSEDK